MILRNLAVMLIGTLAAALPGCAMQVDGDGSGDWGEPIEAPVETLQNPGAAATATAPAALPAPAPAPLPVFGSKGGLAVAVVAGGTEYACDWVCGYSATACIVPGTSPAAIVTACYQALGPVIMPVTCTLQTPQDTFVIC